MICPVCRNMLSRQDGRYAKGTLDILYDHHTNGRTFQQSVQQNCYICRALYINLSDHLKKKAAQLPRDSGVSSPHTADVQNILPLSGLAVQSLSSRASLFLQNLDRTYRLEIRLKVDQISINHKFHLECPEQSYGCPDQRSVHVRHRTFADTTAMSQTPFQPSPRMDFGIVHQWLEACKCYTKSAEPFYPTRLISLENVKAYIAAYRSGTPCQRISEPTVKLVETYAGSTEFTRASSAGVPKHYVTLSHCWGGVVSHRLLGETYEWFKQGIPVEDLPKTFQDAVYFAASLDGVGYIWIDSLCIIQNSKPDWAKESAEMHRVYSDSFLNLSATAALNSDGGLFKESSLEILQEEEVMLDIEGLPQAYHRKAVPRDLQERSRFFERRCTVVDATFWDNQVDKGPVNTRGWVLQERLMSPRVVHFCHDQVGWECACRDARKTLPTKNRQGHNPPNRRSRYHDIVEGIRHRMLSAQSGVDNEALLACSPFDLWAAVVNVYTKTKLTFSTDKLVALSGLAKIISEETRSDYVAGLWRENLAIQLLWYIEPIFDYRDRSFSNPTTFEAAYCAPSFSWAAIDAASHGVTYAKMTKQKLFVTIEDTPVDTFPGNKFGVVDNARITLRGKLRKARLRSTPKNRFAWHLVGRGDLDAEPHRNVYLDCPSRDTDSIDNSGMHVYVLPVAEDTTPSGTTSNLYLVCLMLRAGEKEGTFKRIGITKLSRFMDKQALTKSEAENGMAEYRILTASPSDAMLPHDGYDEKTGTHRLHLI